MLRFVSVLRLVSYPWFLRHWISFISSWVRGLFAGGIGCVRWFLEQQLQTWLCNHKVELWNSFVFRWDLSYTLLRRFVRSLLHLKCSLTLCSYKENSINNQSHSVLVCHLVQAMFTYIHCMRSQAACKQHVHRFLPSCCRRLFPKHCSNTLPLFLHTGLFHRQVASHHCLSKLQDWKNIHKVRRFTRARLSTHFDHWLRSEAMQVQDKGEAASAWFLTQICMRKN